MDSDVGGHSTIAVFFFFVIRPANICKVCKMTLILKSGARGIVCGSLGIAFLLLIKMGAFVLQKLNYAFQLK